MANIKKRIELNQCESLAQFQGFSIQNQGEKTILYIYYEMGTKTLRGILEDYPLEEGFWRVFFPLVRALAFLESKECLI